LAKLLRMPPRIKVLEALGSIADNRIHKIDDKHYEVISSDGTRKYRVYVDLETRRVYSDDNGTKLRGYVGYPIIAILMLNGKLPYNERLANALKGIHWKKLNETYKKYAIVENIVKEKARRKGVSSDEIDAFIRDVLAKLRSMQLYYEEL